MTDIPSVSFDRLIRAVKKLGFAIVDNAVLISGFIILMDGGPLSPIMGTGMCQKGCFLK